jgi:hypothetical protein
LNPLDRYLSGRADVEPDQTIEILMTELDPKVMETFTKAKFKSGREATAVRIYLSFFLSLQLLSMPHSLTEIWDRQDSSVHED